VGKAQSPLHGFNNNAKHRGRMFHIQTEDSGVKYPHVITHLFADGGRILKTVKTSYSEHVGSDGLEEAVRTLMREQHKSMLMALRDGEFDTFFEESGSKEVSGASGGEGRKPGVVAAPNHVSPSPAVPLRKGDPSRRAMTAVGAAARTGTPGVRDDVVPPSEVDVPTQKTGSNFPALTSRPVVCDSERVSSRFTAARPASIFGSSTPPESSASIFGEDLVSGKSLDEVILGFLAEEFGPPPGGKES